MNSSRLPTFARDWLHRPLARRLQRALRIALAPGQLLRRRRVARELGPAPSSALRIDPELGYVRFGPGALPGAEAPLERVRAELERLRPQLAPGSGPRQGGRRLVIELGTDALLEREPELLDFALSDAVVRPVVEYLGEVPYLARVSLPLSRAVPELPEPAHFQRFHVDNDDLVHVKLYVYAQDVGPEHGPLCFLPAPASARVLAALAREGKPLRLDSTFSDEEVFRHCERSELVELVGPRGSGGLVDLSRCLHYGSRVAPGAERFLLGLIFLRWHRLHENAASCIARRGGPDELRGLLLDPPRRHAPGHFIPEPAA